MVLKTSTFALFLHLFAHRYLRLLVLAIITESKDKTGLLSLSSVKVLHPREISTLL